MCMNYDEQVRLMPELTGCSIWSEVKVKKWEFKTQSPVKLSQDLCDRVKIFDFMPREVVTRVKVDKCMGIFTKGRELHGHLY